MKAYGLIKQARANSLWPCDSGNTAEFVMENSNMCLLDNLVDNGTGGYVHRYRLHSRHAMRFEDSLEFDITCPHCRSETLKLCGKPLDWYDHGLYKCPRCDKR